MSELPTALRPGTLIALTGATGFVGSTLLDAALEAGLEVRALVRNPQPNRAGVQWVIGALDHETALRHLCDGVEAVIHVAGVVNARNAAGFEAGNVQGTLRLLEAAVARQVPRFIHVSSLSAREPQLSNYGGSKARAERVVAASGLDWTMVRPPAIYGPGDRDILEIFKAAKWGVVPVPSKGRMSAIHVADLARLLLALVPGGEDVTAKIFEADDGAPNGWSHVQFARTVGWAVGNKRISVLKVSPGMIRAGAVIDRMLRWGRARLTQDRAAYFAHPDWVISPQARPPFARWVPAIPTQEGLKATAAWYREKKWL